MRLEYGDDYTYSTMLNLHLYHKILDVHIIFHAIISKLQDEKLCFVSYKRPAIILTSP